MFDAATPLQARAAFDQLNGTLTAAIAEIDRSLFDLIARLEASVDFPEEGYHFVDPSELAAAIDAIRERTRALLRDAGRGRLIREGLHVAIVGRPNVGKSSLFNALVGAARAIVTEVPGTTRDLISETIDLDGLRVTLVDTAGLRETVDVVESEGVSRSRGAAEVADLTLFVCDVSDPSSIGEPALSSLDVARDDPEPVEGSGPPERGPKRPALHVLKSTLRIAPASPGAACVAATHRAAGRTTIPASWSGS